MARESGLDIHVDSCGTHGYHIGEAPDSRSVKAAKARGVDLSMLRARQLECADFEKFDLLLAMDSGHLKIAHRQCPSEYRHKLRLFLDNGLDVPDPYYGSFQDFEHVYDLCFQACEDLISRYGELDCKIV